MPGRPPISDSIEAQLRYGIEPEDLLREHRISSHEDLALLNLDPVTKNTLTNTLREARILEEVNLTAKCLSLCGPYRTSEIKEAPSKAELPWKLLLTKPSFVYVFILLGIPSALATVYGLSWGLGYLVGALGWIKNLTPGDRPVMGFILLIFGFLGAGILFAFNLVVKLARETLITWMTYRMTPEEWEALPQVELDNLTERAKKSLITGPSNWEYYFPQIHEERQRRALK